MLLRVMIALAGASGQQLLVNMNCAGLDLLRRDVFCCRTSSTYRLPSEACPGPRHVTPAIIRQIIEQALQEGWDPEHPGPQRLVHQYNIPAVA